VASRSRDGEAKNPELEASAQHRDGAGHEEEDIEPVRNCIVSTEAQVRKHGAASGREHTCIIWRTSC